MALIQLNEEQVRTWTRAQKDEWWFKNVFRGNMPQLTIRSGITGFLLGGVLAATALYIAARPASASAGLTSVILPSDVSHRPSGYRHGSPSSEQLHEVDRHRRRLPWSPADQSLAAYMR
jgi:hypothetical protein